MNDYNNLPTTKEEDEMFNTMQTGVPLLNISDGGRTVQYATPPSAEVLHKPDLEQILKTISEQFALLSTVINQTKAQPNAEDQSLQACVDAVLQQSGWFGDKVDHAVNDYIDNEMAWSEVVADPVSSAVDNYFSYEFSLTDHCDIDDIIADKLDDRLENIVSERLREMLSTATISFNN